MNSRRPEDIAVADASDKTASPAPGSRSGQRLTAVLLLAAAALDQIRCSLVPMAAPHPAPAAALIAAGLAAAALSVRTARGFQAGRRWSGWAALLIGATSAPQAAMAGFHSPYTIPDTATAVVGVLLSVAVLATAGPTGQPGYHTENSCLMTGDHPTSHVASPLAPAYDAQRAAVDARPANGVRHIERAATSHQPTTSSSVGRQDVRPWPPRMPIRAGESAQRRLPAGQPGHAGERGQQQRTTIWPGLPAAEHSGHADGKGRYDGNSGSA
jgi:hypothetical protein